MKMRVEMLVGVLVAGAAACSGASHGGGGGSGGGGTGSGGAGAHAGSGGGGGAGSGAAGSAAGAAGTPSGGTGGEVVGTDGGLAGAAGHADAAAGATGADAGGVGPFGFSGPSRCAAADVLLCESFEAGLDSAVWTTQLATDGTATIDGEHAFRGAKALHIKVVNTGHKAAISETKTFPIAKNVLFARLFLWFDTFTTTAHFTMAEAPQTGAGAWIRFGGQFGKFGVGTDHGASGDWLQPDTAPIPTKQLTCMEFELAGDSNEFHVWQDDVPRPALDVGAAKHPNFVMPPFTSLWFGWQTYSNQAPGEVWIDEIAIDSKPIGCAK
jgi:hypothetical protein